MSSRKIFVFLLDATLAGLAFAFVLLLLFRPETFSKHPAVTIQEAPPPTAAATHGASPSSPATSYAAAVQAAAPAVVNIYTAKVITQRSSSFSDNPFFRHFFQGDSGVPRQRLESSLGSGVIISSQGYILTNNHVVNGADEIQVALTDGRSASASVVGTDPETDLALLKISLTNLPAIVFGRPDDLRVGDVVLAIGNPFGVGQTVTQGIVSATGRQQLGISTFENFIQTDAAINPGNSGGALINTAGQLAGINTAIFSRSGGSQGIGFAIPANLAKKVMEQILKQGRVIRGWLGINAQDITPELAESFGIKRQQGAIVSGVYPGSAADHAGLMPGDVLMRVGDKDVTDALSAMNVTASLAPGSHVDLAVIRQGKPLTLHATIGERPPVQQQQD
ncbi:MAG: Do family serine endopeptidase [Gammaproteobacteria bacterium]|jgi:serine protease DegS